MAKVFGIGLGLFLLSILWPTTLIFFMISRRAKPPISTFGTLSVVLMTVLTIILLLIPRKPDTESDTESDTEVAYKREPDLMSLFRPLIIAINIMALLFGLLIIYKKFVCKQIIRPKLSELHIRTVKPIIR